MSSMLVNDVAWVSSVQSFSLPAVSVLSRFATAAEAAGTAVARKVRPNAAKAFATGTEVVSKQVTVAQLVESAAGRVTPPAGGSTAPPSGVGAVRARRVA